LTRKQPVRHAPGNPPGAPGGGGGARVSGAPLRGRGPANARRPPASYHAVSACTIPASGANWPARARAPDAAHEFPCDPSALRATAISGGPASVTVVAPEKIPPNTTNRKARSANYLRGRDSRRPTVLSWRPPAVTPVFWRRARYRDEYQQGRGEMNPSTNTCKVNSVTDREVFHQRSEPYHRQSGRPDGCPWRGGGFGRDDAEPFGPPR